MLKVASWAQEAFSSVSTKGFLSKLDELISDEEPGDAGQQRESDAGDAILGAGPAMLPPGTEVVPEDLVAGGTISVGEGGGVKLAMTGAREAFSGFGFTGDFDLATYTTKASTKPTEAQQPPASAAKPGVVPPWGPPLKSGEGRYVAAQNVLDELEGEGRVVFRYRENLNGSMRDIAGISSADGRVVGLMPHPEHATEALTGPSDDGLGLFYSALDAVLAA